MYSSIQAATRLRAWALVVKCSSLRSSNSTVECELRRLEQFATKAQARVRVAAWIEEYNRDRRHSALGMRSPLDYERALREQSPEAA